MLPNDKLYTVYKHTNKQNGKVYIGITSMLPKTRWKAGYKDCTAFFNALNKYGWDGFYHEIITSNLSKHDACELEKALIQAYKSTDSNYGYNISKGGEAPLLGISPSQETREKLRKTSAEIWLNPTYRENHSGKNAYWYGKHISEGTIQKLREARSKQIGENHPMYGKHHSEESKAKMSKAKKGKCLRGESSNAKSVLQFDVDGNFIQEFECMTDACDVIPNLHIGNMKRCIDGKRKTAGGFIWKFKEIE